MRNILFFFVFYLGTEALVLSQTIVSTSPENRNALIEEFTGIACGFCPYGHLEVANFIAAHPGDGFSIAIHQGFYAIPNEGQPDYRTEAGDGLGSYFSVSAWPTGLVNRHDFGGGMVYPLNDWQANASQVLSEGAYVNIACEAEVDVQTRELTVHVELYYTADSPEPVNSLHVALVQNDVKGPQFSSWFNPDAITPDGAYMHQHMLRDLVTGQWGEEISPATAGTFIDKTYTYSVPESINDLPVRLGDLRIVAFVSETEVEIENVCGAYPDLMNFEYSLDAGIDALIVPETSCGNIASKVVVGNYGAESISSILFGIQAGLEVDDFLWEEGFIEPFKSVEIEVPPVFYDQAGPVDYKIIISYLNGSPDEFPANNEQTAFVDEAVTVGLPVLLHLETDNYFGTAWYLYDVQANVIQQGSGYAYNSTFDIPLVADAGCYKLEMTDLDGYFFGNYSLEDGSNTVFFSRYGNFGNSEVTAFSLPLYAPTAIVDASTTVACIGGTVQFMDASTGGPSEWSWTFEGADPAASTEKNPQVSYSQPGTYDVSLSVSNGLGTDEVVMEDYITVTSLSYGNLALDFDGTNDYVEVSNESAFDFTSELTLEAWIKPGILSGTQGIISKNFGNNAHPYQIRLIEDEIIFGFYSNTIGWQPVQTSSANLVAGQWAHIACTYNMIQAKIFVNGEQKASVGKNFAIPQNDQPLEIGRTKDVAFEYFNGVIDEVRVWDIALDAGQIAGNMCMNYLGSNDPHLVACFKFNECGGTLLTDIQNGNNGVLFEMQGDEWLESDACPVYHVEFLVSEDPGAIPVEGATVNMSGTVRYTDESGQADFDGYEPGTYVYSVTKDGYSMADGSFNLVNEDLTIEISLLISGEVASRGDRIRIYPNPLHGMVNVEVPSDCNLELTDLQGKVMEKMSLGRGVNRVNLSDHEPGVYFMKFIRDREVNIFKIIVR